MPPRRLETRNDRLMLARNARGWTQKHLAEKLNTARTSALENGETQYRELEAGLRLIRQWESGVQPRDTWIVLLCRVFDECDPGQLGLHGPERLAWSVATPDDLPRAPYLIGRHVLQRSMLARLRNRKRHRCYALTGLGGIGKTALAAELAYQVSLAERAFPGGAVWIDCRGLQQQRGLTQLWTRMASALHLPIGVRASPDQCERAVRAHALSTSRQLIVLDDTQPTLPVEQVLDTLFCPGHTVIVLTARHRLRDSRILVYELDPLSEPSAGTLVALQLQARDPGRPAPDDWLVLNQMVHEVGCLPLALGLVSAHAAVHHQPMRAILAELRRSRSELSSPALVVEDNTTAEGDPDTIVEQCFNRSWRYLRPSQRRLLMALSLLDSPSIASGVALTIAETLAKVTETPLEPVADLKRLTDLALLQRLEGGRLYLHALLRRFARRKLDENEMPPAWRDEIWRALSVFFSEYTLSHREKALAFDHDIFGPEAAVILQALSWAHAHAAHQEVASICFGMAQYWRVHFHPKATPEYLAWGDEACSLLLAASRTKPGDRVESTLDAHVWHYVRVRLQHTRGWIYQHSGRVDQARAVYEENLAARQTLGEKCGEADVLLSLGELAAFRGDCAEAERLCAAALGVLPADTTLPVRRTRGNIVQEQTRIAWARREYARAKTLAGQALDCYQDSSNDWGMVTMWSVLGHIALDEDDVATGIQCYQQSLRVDRRSLQTEGDLLLLARLHLSFRRFSRTRELLTSLAYHFHALCDPAEECLVWLWLGEADEAERNFDGAIDRYRHALVLAQHSGDAIRYVQALECLGSALSVRKDSADEGADMLRAAALACHTMGIPWALRQPLGGENAFADSMTT